MSKWHHYFDLEPIRRLRYEGRELLGKMIYVTEKRDGSNVSIRYENGCFFVSSHNQEVAEKGLAERVIATKEYNKICEMLKNELENYGSDLIAYAEYINAGRSPTRMEIHKKSSLVLFDMYDCVEQRYLTYSHLYQYAYHWKIPIVRCFFFIVPNTMEALNMMREEGLKYAKKSRREGVVGKCYSEQIFFKEKRDLPKLERVVVEGSTEVVLPDMPDDKIIRALQHAYDEIQDDEKWKDRAITMPIIVNHLRTEAKEHNYAMPRNPYNIYINTELSKIKGEKELNANTK